MAPPRGPFGSKSAAQVAAEIERSAGELGLMGRRDLVEAERQRQRQPSERIPNPDRNEVSRMQFRDPDDPTKSISAAELGKPRSRERMAAMRKVVGDEGVREAELLLEQEQLGKVLRAYASYDGPQDYGDSVAFELARVVNELDDPATFHQVSAVLDEIDPATAERFSELTIERVHERLAEGEKQAQLDQAKANQERHVLLQAELDRLPAEDAAVAAQYLHSSPEAAYADDELAVKLGVRTLATQSAAQRNALDTMDFIVGITEEAKRRYGPAGGDPEWERELEAGAAEIVERKLESTDPVAAFDRASASVASEGKPSPGLQALNAELARFIPDDGDRAEEVERSKRNFPEKWLGAGEDGSIADRQAEVTGPGTWES